MEQSSINNTKKDVQRHASTTSQEISEENSTVSTVTGIVIEATILLTVLPP